MNAFKQQLATWALRIDAMSFRERVLVCAALCGVLASLLFVGLVEPQLQRDTQNQQIADGLQQEILSLREQSQQPATGKAGQGGELGALNARIAVLEQSLRTREKAFVEPQRMIGLLRELLAQQTGVELVGLEVGAAQPATPATEGESTNLPPQAWRHPTTVRLRGSYAALTQTLARVEALPWALKWTQVGLDARHHPQLVMTLEFDSLSREDTWARL